MSGSEFQEKSRNYFKWMLKKFSIKDLQDTLSYQKDQFKFETYI